MVNILTPLWPDLIKGLQILRHCLSCSGCFLTFLTIKHFSEQLEISSSPEPNFSTHLTPSLTPSWWIYPRYNFSFLTVHPSDAAGPCSRCFQLMSLTFDASSFGILEHFEETPSLPPGTNSSHMFSQTAHSGFEPFNYDVLWCNLYFLWTTSHLNTLHFWVYSFHPT